MASQYIYAFTRASKPFAFGVSRLGGEAQPVRTLVGDGLAVVVSHFAGPAVSTLPRPELLRCLAEHQRVLERVMIEHTALPAKFGTVIRSAAAARRLLQSGRQQLTSLLGELQDTVELDVVVTWSEARLSQVFQEVAREPLITAQRQALVERGTAATVAERARVGQMVQESMLRRKGELRDQMIGLLQPAALAVAVNALLSDEMVMNAAFLLARPQLAAFERLVGELDARGAGERNFRCVGPLPPYSFATIDVLQVSPEEVTLARHLLGLGEQVTEQQIIAAYRAGAARSHPDVGAADATGAHFQQLNWAYCLLRAYCQSCGSAGPCSLAPRDVGRTALLSVRRADRAGGDGTWRTTS